MRIISGVAGGRRLKAPKTSETRPVTDRAREAVFSSIGGLVRDTNVVDLYAGSGSFGLEALSRGATTAVFVESGRLALAALRENVETIGLGGVIVGQAVQDFLNRTGARFDLVFVDPPWDLPTDALERDLEMIDRVLDPGGVVVASRRHTDRPPTPPESWRVATDKRYGDTRILRYEKGTEAE